MQGNNTSNEPDNRPPAPTADQCRYCGCRMEPDGKRCPECEPDYCEKHDTRHTYGTECPVCHPAAGTKALLWISAYAVTRQYGGHEEGGWWYNQGELLATIPIKATWTMVGTGPEGDERDLIADNAVWQGLLEAHLKELFGGEAHGDIYSVLGGTAFEIHTGPEQGAHWPAARPHYE